MPSCAAIGCKNRKEKKVDQNARYPEKPARSIHRFPVSDPPLLRKWLQAMKRDFIPNRQSFLCSDHFTEADLDNTDEIVRLREGAVPSVFDFPPYLANNNAGSQKPEGNLQRVGVAERGMDSHNSLEKIDEDNGEKKQQLQTSTCGPAPQFLKDPACVFTDEQEIELVKCLMEADQIFDGLNKKEVRRFIYEFAVKFNKIIHNPVWDFDGLCDTAWFKKFIERHPSVPIRRRVNSRAVRKLDFTSYNINALLDTVPNLILAGNNPVKHCSIQFDDGDEDNSEKNMRISPGSYFIKRDHAYAGKSANNHFRHEWLYSTAPDHMEQDDNLLNRDVSEGDGSGNSGGSLSDGNVGETVYVMEEEDVLVREENCVFIKEEKDVFGSDKDTLFIKKEKDMFVDDEEDVYVDVDGPVSCVDEEKIFITKENNLIVKDENGGYMKGQKCVFLKDDIGFNKERVHMFIKQENCTF
ncbi:uncharacterized protein LOC121874492 isoform X2 [Homarus americanus]|nr:uncharacterized protein LOC121874492 isoform X2 [Homarus americanus]XP_042234568.1 uncharacterized protein LOC121874492 isoform X2 [Homarus americanus]